MDPRAAEREILEKQLEKRLQDPETEPLIPLPLYFLEDITHGFSTGRVLGEGGYGVVYKGVLRSGKYIAVKKIHDKHLLGNQVEQEIICLKEVRHQNVVQLVGYCVETKSEVMKLPSGKHVMVDKRACLLCFEFLCTSLDKHLSDDTSSLDWNERYKIIRGVCRGLHYLHDKCRIVHRDLKPQNILMDDTMMPKIADFGLSRLLGEQKSKTVTANCAGTIGYMAKESIDKGIISYETDIFSLGVVIIEIITGRRNYPNISETTETSLKHYTDEVVGSWKNRFLEITPMDISLEMRIQQVEQCISIALKCLEPDSKKRPTSLDIVQRLNAVEPKCRSPGKPPSVAEKGTRQNKNLQNRVNMNIITTQDTIAVNSGLKECANLFQWAISSLKSLSNETEKEKLQGDICQLHSDLQCLTDTLPEMYHLIDRAEWRIHDLYVADRLSELKDVVYDAEDLVDLFRWYQKKISVEGNAISVETVIDFFRSVTQATSNKVTDIQKRLDHLSGQLEKMGLLQAVPRFDKSFRPETTTFPTEAKIFGRDTEKKKLVRLLGVPTNNIVGPRRKRKRSGVCSAKSNQICGTIDSNEATITSVPVLPIVGIGGVGKTTLAQDICNNSEVKKHFDLIIWICVSDDFDVKRLTKEAIEQSCRKVPTNDNLNFLQGALANSLKTRRFLLVLDDIWNEKLQEWKCFYAPFRNVLQGSMMLITTRSLKVADVVRTMDPFPLDGLNQDVFREFFKLCVFGSHISNIDPELDKIGEKILLKLKGSPLAAKTIGRLLGMSLDRAHWNGILMSQLWELRQEDTDILPALRLSYMYLPPYLKRCFLFCAVYPKDYSFRKKDLAEIWVAEGFIEHQHTGGQYFEELAHLSFFQKYPQSHEEYVIHDLMHDMAQLVSKDECFIVKDIKDLEKIPQNVRHLLVHKGGDVKCDDLLNLSKYRKLRTLLCDLSLKSKTGNTVMEKWCTELLCMRVMVCSSISKWGFPASICNLKHLRYLKILDSYHCKSLPAEFCCLYNMQIFCVVKWEIGDIPSGFGMLISLQKFESMKYQFYRKHSAGIHKGASATDQGQKSRFVLKNYKGESLPCCFHPQNSEQIHSYNSTNWTFLSLTDVEITDCGNLSSLEQFLQPAHVPIIKKIEICHCPILESVPTERFGDLNYLVVLRVTHCPKIKSHLLFAPSLEELYLYNSGNLGYYIDCSSLTILHLSGYPLQSIELQMWKLPKLQGLEITSCPYLTIIRGSDPISSVNFHGQAKSRTVDSILSSLTDVLIRNCQNLSSLEQFLQPGYVPVIKKIEISECGSLESVLAERFGDLHFLEVLRVSRCPRTKSRCLFAPSLKMLSLYEFGNLEGNIECSSLTILNLLHCALESIELQMWNLPLLQEIQICYCDSLTIIRDSEPLSTDHFHDDARSRMGKFPKLTKLTILSCDKLETIDDLLHLPAIERICIAQCNLLSLPANRLGSLPRLKELDISYCQSLNCQNGTLLPSSLQNLRLQKCGDFSVWFPSCLEKLTSLEELHICGCECIVSVPGHLWSSNLKSLQRLQIFDCSKLKSVGGPGAIAHINDLLIHYCPELKEIDQPLMKGKGRWAFGDARFSFW